jgi:AcrR family transcriptional regulator
VEHPLQRRDWERAALSAIADGGLSAVHIDELAHLLGVTKGSFYWHFESRDDLIEAALSRWRDACVGALDDIDRHARPRRRLRALAASSLRERRDGQVEIALVGIVDDERVTRFVEAVLARRLALLERAFEGLGARSASELAVLANALYVGYLHTVRVDPIRGRRASRALEGAWASLGR